MSDCFDHFMDAMEDSLDGRTYQEGYETRPRDNHLSYESIEHETEKAVLFNMPGGIQHWIPKAAFDYANPNRLLVRGWFNLTTVKQEKN